MPQNPVNISTDLRCAGSLTVDAITGITDIAESLHQTILSFGGILGEPNQSRTTGITGMVYRNIRTVTELVGDGVDALLEKLSSILEEKESILCKEQPSQKDVSLGREAVIAALNGVLGDHLVARNNQLAIPMQFRSNGKPLNGQQLSEAIMKYSGKVAIMVHGLCMNDLQWKKEEHDHGESLARDLGYLPLYLHYNTGLHISENGRRFSDLLETVINQPFETLHELQPLNFIEHVNSTKTLNRPDPIRPEPVKLVIIAHSMGGLVSRSACHYGKEGGHKWVNHLQKLIFLGTPHHGAPLAKGGNWIDNILDINPYSAPFSRLGKIRSCGLTDLRHGNLLDDDWEGRDRFAFSGDNRTPVPLPEGVKCYSLAATTAIEPDNCCDNLVGDGLVTVSSALGVHKRDEFNLLFPETHKYIARNMNHMDILNHPKVYETIKSWLS